MQLLPRLKDCTTTPLPPDVPLATINNPAILDQLQCPICLMILCQPLELPCRALVCTTCTVKWFMKFKCIEVKCPCCYTQLKPAELKPASQLITTLLKDVMVHCTACKQDAKAEDYHTHECSTSPTKGEMKMASRVLADTSPEKCI